MSINQWDKDHPERRKEVQAKYDKKRRSQVRLDYKKDKVLQDKYGLFPGQYELMLEEQNHSCLICGSTKSHETVNRRFAVDHCHTTGKVRGLLCIKCNVGIAMFKDNPELLLSAISYLKNS